MLHIMKLVVGVDDIETLQQFNQRLAGENGGYPYTVTRFPPKQTEEILKGGSLYRVIKGFMCCRQQIKDFVPSTRIDDSPCIKIILEPELIRTQSVAFRPFQGWRYLKPENAPMDLHTSATDMFNLPAKMRRELEELALL